MSPRPQPDGPPDPAAVLAKATLNAARRLGVRNGELARILGISEASVSRLGQGRGIRPEPTEGQLALLFLRLFRSLDAMVGGRTPQARAWYRADNAHLGGVPAELAQRVEGLVHVVEYLDAMRGKL